MSSKQNNLPSDTVAYDLVLKVFGEVEAFTKRKVDPKMGVEAIFDKYKNINNVKPNIEKFPRIQFSLSIEEVEEMQRGGILDHEFRLTKEIFHQITKSQNGSSNGIKHSPLEKLLYSVLWKQGDLGKERHIIEGICKKEITDEGIVFNYFGKHLNNKIEPIIDQHVIRAFRMKSIKPSDTSVRKIRMKDFSISKKGVKAKHELINDYLDWHKKLRDTYPEKIRADFTYHLDLLLFGLGKYIKLTPRQSEKNGY